MGEGVRTLFDTLSALFAVAARVCEPLDADTVAQLDGRILGVCANRDDDTDTLRIKNTRVESHAKDRDIHRT